MRKLGVFNFISLNGCYKGANEDISWNRHDAEQAAFSEESLKTESILLFGRVTYEMMKSFWTTDMAKESLPLVAEGMNKAEKIVFSTTLTKAEWNNTRLIKGNIAEEIKKLKQPPGKDMTILGSGSILTQFAEAGIIDEYQFMIDPVVIADGTPVFKGINHKLDLELINTRTFKSGVVLLTYKPMQQAV